tara:strand:+ start:21947 stop:22480 length:534 start_codon:yes stop_codon:yes gene_type:complete
VDLLKALSKKWLSQMLRRFIVFIFLLLIWIVLSGVIDPFHIIMGVVCCALVTAISGDLVFKDGSGQPERIVIFGVRLIGYLFWLLKELVISNFHVFRLAMSPGGIKDVRPRIIRYQTKLESPFARFILANSITLTPGTITLELTERTLYIHAISDTTAEGLQGPMEKKIGRIFGQKL